MENERALRSEASEGSSRSTKRLADDHRRSVEHAGQAGVARRVGVQCLAAEVVDAGPVDLHRRQTDQSGDRLERAGHSQRRPDVTPVEAIGVEVAVAVPGAPVRAGMAGQRARGAI